jgi:hypothetical protein
MLTNSLLIRLAVLFSLIFARHVLAADVFFNGSASRITPDIQLRMMKSAPGLNPKVLGLAISAIDCATQNGTRPGNSRPGNKLTVIDYSLPSIQPRLWVFDLTNGKLLFNELVAHGKNSGKNYARRFSNRTGSLQSSLGLFQTKDTYNGSNGYSLRMEGLDKGFNDKSMERAIVFHGAPYVNVKHAKKFGHLGRSWGCPAVNNGIAKKVIDTIKGEQFVFSYYPDTLWLHTSKLLNCRRDLLLAVSEKNTSPETF